MKANRRVEVQVVRKNEIPHYWGFKVLREKRSFAELVKDGNFDLTIATSKIGSQFAENKNRISKRLNTANKILIGFGAPTRGLHEIVRAEKIDLNDLVDFVVNTIPEQGTETVRTEEAIIASLAVLNLQFA